MLHDPKTSRSLLNWVSSSSGWAFCGSRFETRGSWDRSDRSLQAVRAAGIRPIAGLVHHGSGPPHTSLLDPEFPKKLAAYAGRVAERYPWIDSYTPVNEPNTTARFSGLYGVWYPHARSRGSYIRALLNQAKATVLSMEEIRHVRSDARLIQTDDLGSISGTEDTASGLGDAEHQAVACIRPAMR